MSTNPDEAQPEVKPSLDPDPIEVPASPAVTEPEEPGEPE